MPVYIILNYLNYGLITSTSVVTFLQVASGLSVPLLRSFDEPING